MIPTEELPRGGYWLQFEDNYRNKEVKAIAEWLRYGFSGAVIGGSGSGKSNLCGFIYSKPQVLLREIGEELEDYLFCYLDVNGLPQITTEFFYRALLRTLQFSIMQVEPRLVEQVNELVATAGVQPDILTMSHVVDQLHKLVIRRTGRTIVWLIDRFDEACKKLEIGALNNLRWLRDQSRFADSDRFRAKLSYVLFTRQPIDRLLNRDEITDFIEIIEDHITWVGAMSPEDTRWNIYQSAQRFDKQVPDFVAELIVKLSGGLTSFIRNITQAYLEGQLLESQTELIWMEKILAIPACRRICEEILGELRPAEQTALTMVATRKGKLDSHSSEVEYLCNLGYLIPRQAAKTDSGQSAEAFSIVSPILRAYINKNLSTDAGVFAIHFESGTVTLDGISVTDQFTPLESKMLLHLIRNRGKLCTYETLEDHLWPHDEVNDDSLEGSRRQNIATFAKQIRQKIEQLTGSEHQYVVTVHGRGFQFDQSKPSN